MKSDRAVEGCFQLKQHCSRATNDRSDTRPQRQTRCSSPWPYRPNSKFRQSSVFPKELRANIS